MQHVYGSCSTCTGHATCVWVMQHVYGPCGMCMGHATCVWVMQCVMQPVSGSCRICMGHATCVWVMQHVWVMQDVYRSCSKCMGHAAYVWVMQQFFVWSSLSGSGAFKQFISETHTTHDGTLNFQWVIFAKYIILQITSVYVCAVHIILSVRVCVCVHVYTCMCVCVNGMYIYLMYIIKRTWLMACLFSLSPPPPTFCAQDWLCLLTQLHLSNPIVDRLELFCCHTAFVHRTVLA